MSLATIHANLRAAYRTRLLTLADAAFAADRVAWEGDDDYQPPSESTPYFSESVRAGPSRRLSFGNANGTGDTLEHSIEATTSLFFPKGDTIAIERCAGELLALFRPGTTLTYAGEGATISNVSRSALYADGARVACAVTVSLYAYTQN